MAERAALLTAPGGLRTGPGYTVAEQEGTDEVLALACTVEMPRPYYPMRIGDWVSTRRSTFKLPEKGPFAVGMS